MTNPFSESRILVCDDSITNALILEKLLESEGYTRVRAVTDSREVAPILSEDEYDLLLLDLEMPHLDGFEVMSQLKTSLSNFEMFPILILTGREGAEVRNRALAMGAHDFVNKPFDQEEVLLRVRNLLRMHDAYISQTRINEELEQKVQARTQELTLAADILVQKLAMVGELRDNQTGRHVMRVGKYARLLAEGIGLPSEIAFMMEKAAPLHDMGKVGIPDRILLKPGPLDEEERREMDGHAALGAKLLGDHKSMLVRMAASVALSHHEKWDGSGYPAGLSGESIPVEGRITAISDVFDALTSKRSYKDAWSIDEAVAEIKQMAGSHFDPNLVKVFEEKLDEIIAIRKTYDD